MTAQPIETHSTLPPPSWAQRAEEEPGNGVAYRREITIRQDVDFFDGVTAPLMRVSTDRYDDDQASAPGPVLVQMHKRADPAAFAAGEPDIVLDETGAEALLRELAVVLGYRLSKITGAVR